MTAMLFVWFAGIIEGLKLFLIILGVILALAIPALTGIVTESAEKVKSAAKRYGVAGVICILLASCSPSEKTTYMMAGAYVGQKVLVESDASKKVYNIINNKLDKYLGEDLEKSAEKAIRNTTDKVEKAVEKTADKVESSAKEKEEEAVKAAVNLTKEQK